MPDFNFSLTQKFILWIIPLIFAITVHEAAHGWVASKLGDLTAKRAGRLTLNPLVHIDWLGSIVVPGILFFLGGFIFGWAKPTPVIWENLKNPRRDMAFVAVAGPLANLLMLIIWGLLAKLSMRLGSEPFIYMSLTGITINLVLMVLNILPIPPLDGSRILASFLSPRLALKFNHFQTYGFLILALLLMSGILSRLLSPLFFYLLSIAMNIFGLPY